MKRDIMNKLQHITDQNLADKEKGISLFAEPGIIFFKAL